MLQNGTVTWPMNTKNMQPQHHPGSANPHHSVAAHRCTGQDNNATDNTYCQGSEYSGWDGSIHVRATVHWTGSLCALARAAKYWMGPLCTNQMVVRCSEPQCPGQDCSTDKDHSTLARIFVHQSRPWWTCQDHSALVRTSCTDHDCGALARIVVH